MELDPLIHAYRSDLADIALADRLFAPHYVLPVTRTCRVATTARAAPGQLAEPRFELEVGDEFALLDVTGDWAWGYRRSDHKVGYLKADALS